LPLFLEFTTQLSPSKATVAKQLATNSHIEKVLDNSRQAIF